MFPPVNRMVMAIPQARREEAVVAGRALKRRNKDKRSYMFTRRPWAGAKDAVLLTLRTDKLTIHVKSVSLITITTSPHASRQLMGRRWHELIAPPPHLWVPCTFISV